MPPSSSTLAHADIQAVMDRALSNGRGCRIGCANIGEAYGLRQRFYTLRKQDREANKKIFEPEDPRWGRSVYDSLIIYPAGGDVGNGDPPNSIYCVIEVSSAERLEERVEDI